MRNIKVNVQNILKDLKQRLLEKQIKIENYSIYSKLEVSLDEDGALKYYWDHTLFNGKNEIVENQELLEAFLQNRGKQNIEVILPPMPEDLKEKINQIL